MSSQLAKPVFDHVLAIVKAGISAVPLVGGPIASLITDYVPTATQRSIERTMELFADKLKTLSQRIDVTLVDKDEFTELFKSCYLIVVRTQREEKLHAAANLLANLLLRSGDPAKASYEEIDHLVRCLDALSIGAILVLGAARQIATTGPSANMGNFSFPQLAAAFPHFEPSFLMSLVAELRALNLLRVQEGGIRTPDHLEVLLELTPVGKRFVERFIEGNM